MAALGVHCDGVLRAEDVAARLGGFLQVIENLIESTHGCFLHDVPHHSQSWHKRQITGKQENTNRELQKNNRSKAHTRERE